MSDASKDARITQLTEANRKQREELGRLREQNGILLGRLRDATASGALSTGPLRDDG
jgi:hypothetical protein